MVTEESTKDTVKTIAQGMPAVAVYPVVADACAFCCTGGYGCNAHPAFPAPSSDLRAARSNNSDISCRETEDSCRQSCRGPSFETRRDRAAPQDEVVTSGTQSDPHGEEARERRLEP